MWHGNVRIFITSRLILLFVVKSAMVIRGEIIQNPENVTTDAGKTVNFTCTSNDSTHDVHWYFSAARQISARIIYDGDLKKSNQDKFKISSEVVNDTRISTLTIKSTTWQDAGIVICGDADSHRKSISAQISVINVSEEPICSAVCLGDGLYLRCSFCYWSENTLSTRWFLGSTNVIHVDEMHSKEVFNMSCLQHQSYAIVERSCKKVDGLSMIIYDSKTNTSSQPYNITVKLYNSESDDTSIDPVQHTTPVGEHVVKERGNTLTFAILFPVIVLLVGLLLCLLIRFRKCNTTQTSLERRSKSSSLSKCDALLPVRNPKEESIQNHELQYLPFNPEKQDLVNYSEDQQCKDFTDLYDPKSIANCSNINCYAEVCTD